MKIRCLLLGHAWAVRWRYASWRMSRTGAEARCECLRCGKILTDFSTPPRQ